MQSIALSLYLPIERRKRKRKYVRGKGEYKKTKCINNARNSYNNKDLHKMPYPILPYCFLPYRLTFLLWFAVEYDDIDTSLWFFSSQNK